jgi:FMN phosphatase YigB (HAD superfamily)
MNRKEPADRSNIRAVIFDLDGTLYDMKLLFKPLLTTLLFPHVIRLQRYMSSRRVFMDRDFGDGEVLLQTLAKETARRCGSNNADEIRRWIDRRFYPTFCRILPFFRGSRPGLDKALRRLKENGIKSGLVSDFACIPERLQALAIDPTLFEHLVSSESEGCLKPCTRPFEKMAKTWDLPNEGILVIGDRSDTDGVAASRLGMQYLQIGGRNRPGIDVARWPDCRRILDQI